VTASEAVTHTITDRVCQVSLHGPPANALGLPLVTGLERALDAFEASTARVLVITSALDGFFAAGADIKLMGSFADAPNGSGLAEFAGYGERLRAPAEPARRVRPAVHRGHRGTSPRRRLELALACTLRVGSRNARLGLPEAKLGLIPGAGGTQRLTRLVGRGRALDIMLTARDVPADEAHAIGLLDRLVEPGTAAAEATTLARTLCTRSGAALTQIMRCVDDADELPPRAGPGQGGGPGQRPVPRAGGDPKACGRSWPSGGRTMSEPSMSEPSMSEQPVSERAASRGITVLRGGVEQIAAAAGAAELRGFDAAWSPEFYTRSAVVTLARMAGTTRRVRIGSAIAYAVGRSPLTIATEARSLDEVSGGRLVLGLGTGTRRMMRDWHGADPDGRPPGWRSWCRCCAGCGGCTRARCATRGGSTTWTSPRPPRWTRHPGRTSRSTPPA